jgi:hypothetical protein
MSLTIDGKITIGGGINWTAPTLIPTPAIQQVQLLADTVNSSGLFVAVGRHNRNGLAVYSTIS